MKKNSKVQLVHLYQHGYFKGYSVAINGVLVDEVLESTITSKPDAPLELTVKLALGLDGSDPAENTLRIDL